jgi:ketosteroid isomerase-like protein
MHTGLFTPRSATRTTRRMALTQFGAVGGAAIALAAMPLPAVGQEATPAPGGDAGKDLGSRFYDAVNSGDEADMKAVLASGFVDRYFVFSEGKPLPPGPDAMAAAVTALRGVFPDAAVTIEEMLAEGDRVAARVVWRGTVPAPYEARQFDFWGVAGGQLTELIGLFDAATFTAQLTQSATPTG